MLLHRPVSLAARRARDQLDVGAFCVAFVGGPTDVALLGVEAREPPSRFERIDRS
jgi:hypothetical protein